MCSTMTGNLSSTAAERVAGVGDLILQILLRLPAKPVTGFKLVSKQWYSLISDTKFVRSHIRRNNITSALFLNSGSGAADSVWLGGYTETCEAPPGHALPTLDFLEEDICGHGYRVILLQSLNGLWLCRFTCDRLPYCDTSKICICNPTTKRYRILPRPTYTTGASERWQFCGLGFAYDPSMSFHYKVICVKCLCNSLPRKTSFSIEVYSSEHRSWRSLLQFDQLGLHYSSYHDRILFWNGGVHLVGGRAFHFDLNSETVLQAETPGIPQTLNDSFGNAMSCGGKEAYMYLMFDTQNELYVLEMSDCKWVIRWKVNFCVLTSAYPEIVKRKRVICKNGERKKVSYLFSILDVVERPENEESAVLVLAIPCKIISYNFVKKTVKTLHGATNIQVGIYGEPHVPAFQFMESLSSV